MTDFQFFRRRPSSIFGLFYAFSGLCDRRSNFDSTQVLAFCALSLKMFIHDAKKGVLGGFERDPSRHFLARKHVV